MSTQRLPQPVAQPQQAPSDERAERQQFYTFLWGDTAGWVEIVAGLDAPALARRGWLRADERADDPGIRMLEFTGRNFDEDKANGRPHTRAVFRWPAEASKLDAYAQRLKATYGNVFTCINTYAHRHNGADTPHYGVTDPLPRYPAKPGNKLSGPLPSCVLLVEDAPAHPPLPYSLCVETSANSHHGYYRTTTPLLEPQLVRLGQGAARKLGADPSGVDRQQRIRIPATRNTKPKCGPEGAPVRLMFADGPTYPIDQLAREFLPGGMAELGGASDSTPRARGAATSSAGRDTGAGDKSWQKATFRDALDKEAEPWRPLVRTGRGGLLADNGMPRGLKPDTITYKILAARQRGEYTYYSASGRWDASRERNAVILGLMYIGYTDGQIAAMAEKLANFGEEGGFKSTDDIWLDICRVICKLNAELGDKRRIRTPGTVVAEAATVAERPYAPRASRGKGRPRVDLDTVQFLAFYTVRAVEGCYHSTRRADAAALGGISIATLDRLDDQLKAEGAITISRQGNGRVVALQGCVKNAAPVASKVPAQGCVIGAVQPIVEPNSAGAASRESTPRPVDLPAPVAVPLAEVSPAGAAKAAGVLSPEADPTPPAPLQDIDVSRISGSATEERMATVYRAQGEQVRIIPVDEQARTKRGDLERILSGGRVIFSEIKGEREYPGRCAAIEFETVPLNRVAYGGASGPAESRANTFTYVNATTGEWWELPVATVRALLPLWQQQYRIIDGKINERTTPYGHARYHTRCVLVPHVELARHAIVSGVAPDVLAVQVQKAARAIRRDLTLREVNKATGELKPGAVTVERLAARLPDCDSRAVVATWQRLETERLRQEKSRKAAQLDRQCAQFAERAQKWRLKTLEAKARSYGSLAAERARAGRSGEAYVWRRLGGVIEAEIMRRTDVAAEDEAIDAEIALAADRCKACAASGVGTTAVPQVSAPIAEQLTFDAPSTPMTERPAEAPNKAHGCSNATSAPSATPGAAGESTGAYAYEPGFVPSMLERLRALKAAREGAHTPALAA